MFFISSEKKERHSFIDHSIEATRDVLLHEQMSRHLGTMALFYERRLNNLYVPNHRHGKAILKKSDDSSIPVLALKPGESVLFPAEMGLPSHAQRARATEVLRESLPGGEHWTDATTDQVIAYHDRNEPVLMSISDTATAMVQHQTNHFRVESDSNGVHAGQINGRPMMAIKYPSGFRVDPSVMIHELDHIAEGGWNPVQRHETIDDMRKDALRGELQAYYVQSLAIRAMVRMGYEPHSTEKSQYSVEDDGRIRAPLIGTVEELRQRTNAERADKFFPNDELIDELERRGLSLVSL